jgi:ATP synthase protein I
MGRAKAYKQLILQVVISMVFAAVALFANNLRDAYSAVLGGCAVIIPTLLFILLAFRHDGARAASKIAGFFMLGEAFKLLTMAIIIAAVFAWIPVQPLVFLLTFLAVQLISTVVSFWHSNRVMVRAE